MYQLSIQLRKRKIICDSRCAISDLRFIHRQSHIANLKSPINMSDIVIKIENLSKIYRLGEVGTGTLSHDLNRWWKMNVMRQDDPYAKIGHLNDRTQKAEKGELVAALRDINLEVKQGEVLGIIGKNGAGKSTLLKLLSRVTSPTTGTIKTKGRLASLLEVGTGFHPEMTGRENIYMNGTIMGMRKWEITRKLEEIVDFAGVAKYMDTPVKRYSSGMTVRLGFAVAAFLEPEILIVDEVLAVGDAEFQKKAIGKMQDISKGHGRTVLFVSHNMASVESLCNKCALISNGSIIKQGETTNVIDFYLNDKNQQALNSDLITRKDRSGNGKAKFFKYEILDDNSKLVKTLKSGGDYVITLHLENKGIDDFNSLVISMGIDNQKGIRIGYLSNSVTHESAIYENSNDTITVKIAIPRLPLMEGIYPFTLFSENGGEILDWIANAGYLTVEQGDYYNTGKLLPKGQGEFLMNYSYIKKVNYVR